MHLEDFVERDFEQVQVLRDPARGVLAIVAVHDTRLGPAFGGIRRLTYRHVGEAFDDALRLAEAMTWKCAVAEVPGGGAKTVIAVGPDTDREAAYELVGDFVEQMGGRYYTGPDVGTETRDLEVVAGRTRFVARPGAGGPGNLAEPTARGVAAGIRTVGDRLGGEGLAGLRVVVQGLGEVGRRVTELLVQGGAEVTVSDVRREAVERAAVELGVAAVDPGDLFAVDADIYAPCALGGVIHDLSLKHLNVRAVAGSANNVLASPAHGLALFERGVLYAPDFVINAGALVHGALFHLEGSAPPVERIERIGELVGGLLDDAQSSGTPPEVLALERARARVAAAPSRPFLPGRGR